MEDAWSCHYHYISIKTGTLNLTLKVKDDNAISSTVNLIVAQNEYNFPWRVSQE